MDNTRKLLIESAKYGIFEVLIDEEDWQNLKEKYVNLKLYISKGAKRKNRYFQKYRAIVRYGEYGHSPSQRKQQKLSRLIMENPAGLVVDHINGKTLDNRRCNLRVCTNAENSRNSKLVHTSASGYKGVHCAKANGSKLPWRARIKYNYKELQLGTFASKEEAARAYDKKAIELFGDYAKLNFPREQK